MGKYVVKYTVEQFKIVEKSLDLYSRILCGQLEELTNVLRWDCKELYDINGNNIGFERLNEFGDELCKLKTILGLPNHGHHGIHNPNVDDKARKSYDIYQQMVYHRSLHEKNKKIGEDERDWKTMYQTCYDEPVKTSHDPEFKLPSVEIIEEDL